MLPVKNVKVIKLFKFIVLLLHCRLCIRSAFLNHFLVENL